MASGWTTAMITAAASGVTGVIALFAARQRTRQERAEAWHQRGVEAAAEFATAMSQALAALRRLREQQEQDEPLTWREEAGRLVEHAETAGVMADLILGDLDAQRSASQGVAALRESLEVIDYGEALSMHSVGEILARASQARDAFIRSAHERLRAS